MVELPLLAGGVDRAGLDELAGPDECLTRHVA